MSSCPLDTVPAVEIDATTGEVRLHDARAKLGVMIRSRAGWFLVAAALLIMALAGFWAIEAGYMRDKPASGRTPTTRGFLLIILVVGLAGIVVVGGYLLVVLRRYNDTDADLVIAPSGMTDRWLVDQPVPWAEIRRVRFVPGYAIKAVTPVSPHAFMSEPGYVDIEYLDDNAYLERLIGYDRRRVKKYRDRTGRTASVPLSGDGGLGFALPASDIAWLMARYCKVEGLPPGYRPQHPVLAAVSA